MRLRRRAPGSGDGSTRPRTTSWFHERLRYWRERYRLFWSLQPTVDQRQRLEDDRARLAGLQVTDEIARSIAYQRVWWPREVPPALPFVSGAVWDASPSVTEPGAPIPAPGPTDRPWTWEDERAADLASPNPNNWLKWQSDTERLGPRGGW